MKPRSLLISTPWLEKAVLAHVGLLLFSASWVCGGNISWMRSSLTIGADLGVVLTVFAFLQTGDIGREARRKAWWLIPWLLYVALVITSYFNPSFTPITQNGQPMLAYTGALHPLLPSTVIPERTLQQLGFCAGVYLAAFNLLLTVRSRRSLRGFLTFGAINTGVLAVFGTIQKISSSGYYFGALQSPNIRFFATFIYNNHWGAFMILWLATAAGLLFYHVTHYRGRDLWHSPFTLAVIGVLLLVASALASASRAAVIMAALVAVVTLVHAIVHIMATRRREHRSIWPPVFAVLTLFFVSALAMVWLAQRSLEKRYEDTRLAVNQSHSVYEGLMEGRVSLYADTWKLALQKPAFGWGLHNYGFAFMLIRPRSTDPTQQYVASYMDAHSDWLQSLAETGFTGTGLLLLMAFIPLFSIARRTLTYPAIGYPLLGCLIISLYAWVEFPFGNGAVFIAFWAVYFTAIRLAQLQARATDHAS